MKRLTSNFQVHSRSAFVTLALFRGYSRQLLAALLILCAAPLKAQELREFEFTVYGQYPVRGVEYDPVSEAATAAGEEVKPPQAIETHTLARMGPYSVLGGSLITFVDSESQQAVARVKVPEGSERWLLIFVRNPRFKDDPENNLKYLVYPFNDSLSHLPADQLVFLNISGKELDGLLEDKRVKIERGESDSIKVQESLPVNLWTRDFSGERLLPALIKTYRFEPNHRYLMIFFPPVLRGSSDLDTRFLSEKLE